MARRCARCWCASSGELTALSREELLERRRVRLRSRCPRWGSALKRGQSPFAGKKGLSPFRLRGCPAAWTRCTCCTAAAGSVRRSRLRLRAVHVHHGPQPQADACSRIVRRSAHLAVPLEVIHLELVPRRGEASNCGASALWRGARAPDRDRRGAADRSPSGRSARDRAAAAVPRCRGCWPCGLMPKAAPFGRGVHRGPCSADAGGDRAGGPAGRTRVVEDPSNSCGRFDRAFLRREVLPGCVGAGRRSRSPCPVRRTTPRRRACSMHLRSGCGRHPGQRSAADRALAALPRPGRPTCCAGGCASAVSACPRQHDSLPSRTACCPRDPIACRRSAGLTARYAASRSVVRDDPD